MKEVLAKFREEYITILGSNAKVLAPQEVYDAITEVESFIALHEVIQKYITQNIDSKFKLDQLYKASSCIYDQTGNGSRCPSCNRQYIARGGNSISGQPLCFVNGCEMNTSIGQKGDPCGVQADRSTQSKPPDKLINKNLVDIAVQKIDMDQMKSKSSVMPCSFSDINKESKRRKKSDYSEACNHKCGFVILLK
ncbi:hypothetical protein AgCh_034299 [Apium graveolens]